MNNILYYSNFCNHCKNLLNFISKFKKIDEIHFICIDHREKNNNGEINIILSNGQKILLPPNVTKVPALMLLNRGRRVLFGEEIINFFKPKKNIYNQINNNEPLAFSFDSKNEVISDTFSFLDMSAKDLLAKGNGGLRLLHNYATLDLQDNIETPPETNISKSKQNLDINKIQEQRNQI
tara:strand:- start:74 stop:610 length:537 start_codon:yes stop_codon:yes gene_type:complete